MGDNWDSRKMFELYVRDYMISRNMHTTAEIFSREAGVPTDITPTEGFLSDWWGMFWDMYCSRLAVHPQATQISSSQATQNAGNVQQNALPMQPVPDMNNMLQNNMLQNMYAATQRQGIANQLGTVNRPTMPMPGMGNLLQSSLPRMAPGMELGPNRVGLFPVSYLNMRQEQSLPDLLQTSLLGMTPGTEFNPNIVGLPPVSDANMRREQTVTDLMAERMRGQELPRFPGDQLAPMLPSSSRSSHLKKMASSRRQYSATRDENIWTSGRSTTAELPPHPSLQQNIGTADAGRGKVTETTSGKCSSTGVGCADNTPLFNQQKQFSSSSARFEQDSIPDLAASASAKLVISASRSSTKVVNPTTVGDGSKRKHLQIERSTGKENAIYEDIVSVFSDDEASGNKGSSFGRTSPQVSFAPKIIEEEGFSFEHLRSLHPDEDKLTCCDFSTAGKFMVTAGHAKKVFIWNLEQSTGQTIEAHSQLITDIRFKPNSNMFATSSLDRSVKIWDAVNVEKPPLNLVGHEAHVISLDFHPSRANLLCSCDSNAEMRLWNVREATCFRSFKEGSTQVRFQPRLDNLLAAVVGNVIILIDVETGAIRHRLEGHDKDISSICWDVCGEYLASVGEDGARMWSLTSGGTCIHHLNCPGKKFVSCAFHPAYAHVVLLGSYEYIDIWNPIMRNKTWTVKAHEGMVSALAATKSNVIASVSHDQWVKLWK